jgi:hypothetical protein
MYILIHFNVQDIQFEGHGTHIHTAFFGGGCRCITSKSVRSVIVFSVSDSPITGYVACNIEKIGGEEDNTLMDGSKCEMGRGYFESESPRFGRRPKQK